MPTIPVTERALLARVNRVLAKSDEVLKKVPERSWRMAQYGPYYRLDINRNVLLDSEIDLEELARKLGVMGAWEHKL